MTLSWNSPLVAIDGRLKGNNNSCRCSYPGVSFMVRIKNGKLMARFQDYGIDSMNNHFTIVVDEKPVAVLRLSNQQTLYDIATFSDNKYHNVQLIKRTESLVGECEFFGFELTDDADITTPERPSLLIEYIGDSITCGYGIEATRASDDFSDATENAWLSYASVTSRLLEARQSLVCFSGKGVYRNWASEPFQGSNMNDLFTRCLANSENDTWKFRTYKPNIVVVALGSNDFSPPQYANETLFKTAYTKLLHKIRKEYGKNTPIVCVTGPVLVKKLGDTHDQYVQEIVTTENSMGDSLIYFFAFARQSSRMGYGAQWHPNSAQAQKNGEELALYIKEKVFPLPTF